MSINFAPPAGIAKTRILRLAANLPTSAPAMAMIPATVVGRATIDDIVEHMHESRERGLLSSAGIREEEDLFCAVGARFYESLAVDMHKPCGGTFGYRR